MVMIMDELSVGDIDPRARTSLAKRAAPSMHFEKASIRILIFATREHNKCGQRVVWNGGPCMLPTICMLPPICNLIEAINRKVENNTREIFGEM